jgi:hypothetical protein
VGRPALAGCELYSWGHGHAPLVSRHPLLARSPRNASGLVGWFLRSGGCSERTRLTPLAARCGWLRRAWLDVSSRVGPRRSRPQGAREGASGADVTLVGRFVRRPRLGPWSSEDAEKRLRSYRNVS